MPEALDEARAARDHRLGFQTLDQERPPAALPVEGRLSGSLLRTGPARFEVGSRGYNHWFDGLAMLHRFAFAGGAVTYANRFLGSPAYRAARDTGRIAYSEFATDPCRTLFRRASSTPEPALRRYRLSLRGGDATREALPAVSLELPRIDYDRRNGRPYRYVYGTGLPGDGGFPDRITKADVEGGPPAVWSQPGTYPGEPVFFPAPGGQREDDGVLLSVVLEPGAGTSFLLVLDAGDLSEIARAGVPHHIPFGFHGDYFPGLT